MNNKKVLIVEDDISILKLLEFILKKKFTVIVEKDGESALNTIKEQKPDIVISDVMMPKLSGIELKNAVKNVPELKNIPFIFLTADVSVKEKVNDSEVIIKPVSPSVIKNKIDSFFADV
jgi:CheY-like chemotaxis protein